MRYGGLGGGTIRKIKRKDGRKEEREMDRETSRETMNWRRREKVSESAANDEQQRNE